MSIWAIAAGAAALYAAWTLLRFSRADADLALLSKGRTPAAAFRGRVVWIVGASQGLGEALAQRWAALGASLVLSSRSLDKLQAVRTLCLKQVPGADIELLPFDLTAGEEELDAAVRAANAAFGGAGADLVVHNVGASQRAAAEKTTCEAAEQLIRLNLLGPVALARAALPAMLQRGGGRHVVIASMSAVVPSPGQAVYAAAKAGLKAYFASVASELADRGVSATVVCPGPFASGSNSKPRSVFGPRGPIHQANTGISQNKVAVDRAAELVITAAYHRLNEGWIARHPVLLMGYLMQYLPWAGNKILQKVGPARARQLRDGSGSGYDVAAMLRR